MPTDAKTNELRLGNDALRLFMSAGNVEYPAFHGLKRIMQRCNNSEQKIGKCLQRCKCRKNEKSPGNLDFGITWMYC